MSRRTAEDELRVSGKGLFLLVLIIIGIIAIAISALTTTYSVGVSEAGILVNTIDGSPC